MISGRRKVLLVLSLLVVYLLLPSRRQHPPHDPTFGLVNETSGSSRFAIATFLTGNHKQSAQEDDLDTDYYYIATRIIAYQLLHAPETRCNMSVSFAVLVTSMVSERKRQQLRSDGAIVMEVEDVPLRWWIKTGVTRWKDQFTKLRLFEMTQFDRVLFIDADTLITRPLDGIFDELEVRRPADTLFGRETQTDEAPFPAQYMFAARSDNALTGERDHSFPPHQTEVFSAGFWIAAPSHEMFAYLLSVMNHYRRFDPHTMEQSLLNYAFRRAGPMPWREIHYKWSATWPSSRDVDGQVVTLHEKFWSTGPQELRNLWWEQKRNMEHYHSSAAGKGH